MGVGNSPLSDESERETDRSLQGSGMPGNAQRSKTQTLTGFEIQDCALRHNTPPRLRRSQSQRGRSSPFSLYRPCTIPARPQSQVSGRRGGGGVGSRCDGHSEATSPSRSTGSSRVARRLSLPTQHKQEQVLTPSVVL